MSYGVLMMVILTGVIEGGGAQNVGVKCIGDGGKDGICVALPKCRELYTLQQIVESGYASDEDYRKFENRPICSHHNYEEIVCCVGYRPRITTTTASPQGQSLLPERCGHQRPVDRIIGGEDAPLGAWPWMVAFRGREGGRRFWFCGGSLITDRYVLSAAHCFTRNIEQIIARIGEHDFSTNPDTDKDGVMAPIPQEIRVESSGIILHPSFNDSCKSECNDIALIRLTEKATLHTHFVMPICLSSNPKQDMGFSVQDFAGRRPWAAGWGTINPDPENFRAPEVLQQVQLLINQSTVYCKWKKDEYSDPDMIICAGREGKDTCRGDSGGPLTLTNNDGTKHFLVGITSRGPVDCAHAYTSGTYTSVLYYMDWIMSNLRNENGASV